MPMQHVALAPSYERRRDVKLPMIRDALAGAVAAAFASGGHRVVARSWTDVSAEAGVGGGACESNGGGGGAAAVSSMGVWGAAAAGVGGGPRGARGRACFRWTPVLYAETNPNFKAWFYDVVLDALPGDGGYAVDVVHLRKYLPALVKSLYETGYFTTRDGHTWMETGDGVNALVRAPAADPPAAGGGGDDGGARRAVALDALLSYAVNAEAVGRAVAARYGGVPGVRVVDARSEVLYGRSGAVALVADLGLTPTAATAAVAGVRVDKYEAGDGGGARQRGRGALPLADAEAATARYLARCAAQGVPVPPAMVHLRRVEGFAYPP